MPDVRLPSIAMMLRRQLIHLPGLLGLVVLAHFFLVTANLRLETLSIPLARSRGHHRATFSPTTSRPYEVVLVAPPDTLASTITDSISWSVLCGGIPVVRRPTKAWVVPPSPRIRSLGYFNPGPARTCTVSVTLVDPSAYSHALIQVVPDLVANEDLGYMGLFEFFFAVLLLVAGLVIAVWRAIRHRISRARTTEA
jgi:hypothetical protein